MKHFRRLLVILLVMHVAPLIPASICEAKKKARYSVKPDEVQTVQADTHRRQWGMGLIIGDPTGVTVKYWLDRRMAWDFALGSQLSLAGVGVHADYLFHLPVITDTPEAPLFIGGGAFLGAGGNQVAAGLRGVVGMTYIFSEPFDIFMQLSPTLAISPDFNFYFTFSIGGRVYL
ncbi:MAG: hypothetical protein AB1439_02225 [candidate division FCPU426 bacterium]